MICWHTSNPNTKPSKFPLIHTSISNRNRSMAPEHFIRGKSCEDYITQLDFLEHNPVKHLSLNEDSFTNWGVNKHPIHTPRIVYDEFGKINLQDG